ncbi:DMT family transporter [Kocuria rhizophila]|uniref:DMT family transporter n=1 Tax=Kocuria rhizophila TaxID=72000 RepID=UPI0021A81104|nr:SMR family transporter [Kocuria rhizophila]MCT1455961.1 SMR family transporter [Kocuria rhizophila]MCT2248911.1 SMR family transporter [Kocuria rhizophila]
MKKWLYLVGAIVLEVSGSLSLKAAMDAPAFYAIVVVGYLGAFIGLFASLRHGMNLGVGYGIWGATGVAATAVLSLVIFHEPITPVMGFGIVLVIAGVLTVELGSQIALKKQDTLTTGETR